MAKLKPRFGLGTGTASPVHGYAGERLWRRRTLWLVLLAVGLAWASEAPAQNRPLRSETVSGYAVALDGQTLQIDWQRVFRLWGIEAPDMRTWPWGAYARTALSALIGPGPVACRVVAGRVVAEGHGYRKFAICSNDTLHDIGAAALVVGYAVASRGDFYVDYEPEPNIQLTYDLREGFARSLRRGLWRDWPGFGK